MFKRFICGIMSALICVMGLVFNVSAEETEKLVYRTSGIYTTPTKYEISWTLKAYDNGEIKINNIVSGRESSRNIGTVGPIAFNDSIIAAIGEVGASGTSYCRDSSYYFSRIESYTDTGIFYEFLEPNSISVGNFIFELFFYVYQDYLTTAVTINIFDTEVEIPFGTDEIKTGNTAELEAEIDELKKENSELKSDYIALKLEYDLLEEDYAENDNRLTAQIYENEQLEDQIVMLKKEIKEYEATINAMSRDLGDMNGDGKISIGDAVLLTRVVADKITMADIVAIQLKNAE